MVEVGTLPERHLLSLLRGHLMKRVLARLLDETGFLSPHGVRSLSRHHRDEPHVFTGRTTTIRGVVEELARRLISIFLPDERGWRPVFGENEKLQTDPHFRDHVLFHEYFHGDTGRGIGASHQTGWTALVAELLHSFPLEEPRIVESRS